MTDQLQRVVASGMCNGCGGCTAIPDAGIKMRMVADGYLRPHANFPLDHQQSEFLKAICGGATLDHPASDTPYHPTWGPILDVRTGFALDEEIRYRGSSGGVLTALCVALVESGAVDFVLSTSADRDDPLGNETSPRRSREELIQAAGSRYAPSSPLENLERYLVLGKKFAFVGKPCDVATLRRMARSDDRIDRLIPFKLAFFCAGVPSRRGTLEVLKALNVTENDVSKFVYRGEGWPGFAKATRLDGSSEAMDYNSSWGQILNRYLQFRCKICPDGTGEYADIACADAWYGKDGYPDFTERDGRSLIVVRTEVGRQLLEHVEKSLQVASEPLDVSEIAKMQPYQVNRKSNVNARRIGILAAGRPVPSFRKLRLLSLSAKHSVMDQLRNMVGTWRRVRGRPSL